MAVPYGSELRVGLEAVRLAAKVCQSVQSAITTEALAKKDNSPVTVADYGSQAIVCRALKAAFPNDHVIGEEGAAELRTEAGRTFLEQVVREVSAAGVNGTPEEICDWIDHGGSSEYSARFWTLDPIDGTKGFLRKEQYAISLALIINGQIELGILGCPNMPMPDGTTGVIAWAIRGHGAWQQSLSSPESPAQAIKVSLTSTPSELVFCESVESGHSSHDWSGLIAADLQIHREAVRMDSQCKYALLARGDADLVVRMPRGAGHREDGEHRDQREHAAIVGRAQRAPRDHIEDICARVPSE